ncbi:actin-like isoform X1 [Pecten maximus]|uniref:actin-like isoform X1 n=1 Tax=Pecten maximus TaxID=6579 RepID=UPI001458DD99|nr:actin-like isoform X1 [Pecten maximus]
MEQIWDYLFYQKMQIDPEIWQLATAEPLLSPMAQVEAKAQIFFEKYKFPSLCVTDEGTQTMLSKGYSSCICVCIGDGTTTISAVSDSFRIPSATQKLEIGGRDVTMFLQSLLCNNGYSFVTPGELEILREIKEKHCYALEVPLSGQAADTRVSYREESLISLPGGDVIPMTSEKWKCAEVLFDPSLAGLPYPGLHHAIKNCLNNVPINVRKELMERIVLSGGTAEMTGLPQRLLQEMKKINTYPGCVPQVKFTPDDNSSNWIGLSIVGSLYDSEDRWVSEAEYEEFGTDLCTEQTC